MMVLSLNMHSLEENKNKVRDRTVSREMTGLSSNPVRTDLFSDVVFCQSSGRRSPLEI